MKKYTYKHRHREKYKGVNIDCRASSSKELIEKVNKKKKAIDNQIIDNDIRLLEWSLKWLETYKANKISLTRYNILKASINKMVDYIGNIRIKDIKPIQVQQFLNSLTNYCQQEINNAYTIIKGAFTRAYRDGLIEKDLCSFIDKPFGKKTKSRRSLTTAEKEAFLKVVKGHDLEVGYKLMLFCGLRVGEMLAIQWKDIDLQNMLLDVNKAYKADSYIGTTKSKAGVRQIPIPMHLKPLLIEQQSEPFSLIVKKIRSRSFYRILFCSVFKNMQIEMGCRTLKGNLIPPYPITDILTMYNLRHTYCTDLEKAGVPINIASRLMGHSNITITSKIYTHASDEALEIARRCIDA